MNKTKISFTFLFGMILLLVMSCGQSSKKHENKNTVPSTSESSTISQQPSTKDLYERLMTSFSNDWLEREADPSLYPDYYGGTFTDENGTFVITVTGNREEHKQHFTEILGTENFKVETVRYSYRQLMQVMDNIDAFLMSSTIPENHPLMDSFAGAYPDVKENRVKVLLTKVDDATIRLFKREVIDSPLVVFEKGEQPAL